MNAPRPNRIRIRFSKLGRIRFTSHRDVARVWERALRRTRLPVAYSEGFSPRPRLHFGLALATAHESWGEYLDVDLRHDVLLGVDLDLDGMCDQLTAALPEGMAAQVVAPVAPGTPSLQEAVVSCQWLVELPGVAESDARAFVHQVLTAPELPVTRSRKEKIVRDDLRPAVLSLHVVDPQAHGPLGFEPSGAVLAADLAAQPRACRPGELLQVFAAEGGAAPTGVVPVEGRVVRTHQWTLIDGERREPLPLYGDGSAPWAPVAAEVEGPLGEPLAPPSIAAHAGMRAS